MDEDENCSRSVPTAGKIIAVIDLTDDAMVTLNENETCEVQPICEAETSSHIATPVLSSPGMPLTSPRNRRRHQTNERNSNITPRHLEVIDADCHSVAQVCNSVPARIGTKEGVQYDFDEVEIVESVPGNMCVTAPHARASCLKQCFRTKVDDCAHVQNLEYCEMCFCYVCDVRASNCMHWYVHSMAFPQSYDWHRLRVRTREFRRGQLQPGFLQIKRTLLPPRVLKDGRFLSYFRPQTNEKVVDLTESNIRGSSMPRDLQGSNNTNVKSISSATPYIRRDHGTARAGGTLQRATPFPLECSPAEQTDDSTHVPQDRPQDPRTLKCVPYVHLERHDGAPPAKRTRFSPPETKEEDRIVLTNEICSETHVRPHAASVLLSLPYSSSSSDDSPSPKLHSKPHTEPLAHDLNSLWSVENLLPSEEIIERFNLGSKCGTAVATPRPRTLVGYLTFWRPYCSHMPASIPEQFSAGPEGDIFSFSKVNEFRAAGLPAEYAAVIAREIGFDFQDREFVCNGDERNYREEGVLHDGDDIEAMKTSRMYQSEDGTAISDVVLDSFLECIKNGRIEVLWQVSHCPHQTDKMTFSRLGRHSFFSSLESSVKQLLLQKQIAWFKQCNERIREIGHYNGANCCFLKASVYITSKALGSNMVVAASFCSKDSPYFQMVPFDGPTSLAQVRGELRKANGTSSRWSRDENVRRNQQSKIGKLVVALKPVLAPSCVSILDIEPISDHGHAPVIRSSVPSESVSYRSMCVSGDSKLDERTLRDVERLSLELGRNHGFHLAGENSSTVFLQAILSSHLFMVSNGYKRSAEQPGEIALPLFRYQRETLAWMQDQEKKTSISEPFWIRVHEDEVGDGFHKELYYCPFTGSLTRFPPPPVVGGLLGHETGLGKTVMKIALILSSLSEARKWASSIDDNRLRSSATLIVCPTMLISQWEEEIHKCSNISTRVLVWVRSHRPRKAVEIAKHDIVLTTYAILSNGISDPLSQIEWFRVVLDESTHLTTRGRGSGVILGGIISRRRWGLSGSPFADNFESFHPIFRFLGISPFSRWAFFKDLAGAIIKRWDYRTDLMFSLPALAYVLKHTCIRHLKNQDFRGGPLIKLPRQTGMVVEVQFSESERREYNSLEWGISEMAKPYIDSTNKKSIPRLHGMVKQLQQCASGMHVSRKMVVSKSPSRSGDSSTVDRVFQVVEKVFSNAKVKRFYEDLSRWLETDPKTKVVVFTAFHPTRKRIIEYLQGRGVRVLTVHGKQGSHRRGKVINEFLSDSEKHVLVATTKTASRGLNLSMANVVVLFEATYIISNEYQAVNRIHRIGQLRDVLNVTYVTRGTVDERVVHFRRQKGDPGFSGERERRDCEAKRFSLFEMFKTLLANDLSRNIPL